MRRTRLNSSTQRAIRHCINSARRRATLQANRRLNCNYEPKFTEEELKRWDNKDYWTRPDRYLSSDHPLKHPWFCEVTVRDYRFVDPNTHKGKPVAEITSTGMIKFLDESAKIPEARAIIDEIATNVHKRWLQVRARHSADENIENITHATVYGVYPWSRPEALAIEGAVQYAVDSGADPQQVADDYQIVMYCTGFAERDGYEYPEGAGIDVARVTKLAHDAINHTYRTANSSRKTNSVRQSITARRCARLNGSTRYSTKYRVKPNGDSFTLYFISDDGLSNAVFDVDPDFQGACNVEGEILGADANWEIDSYENWFNSSESRDIYELLRYDAEGSTGVDMHECSEADYNASCIAVEQAKKQLNSSRRLNSGKLFYDDATGEYEEYEYDDEQDAWYQLPDEMYIYQLDLSQFTDLVRDGIVSKHEIHEWIDELSEDWGGMPAWSPAKLVDKFEIQDLTEDEYYTWKDNFSAELARFADAVTRR